MRSLFENQHCDWTTLDASCTACRPLSAARDARWAGIQVLAPFDTLELQAHTRHDLYVLRGSLMDRGKPRPAGSFLSRSLPLTLSAQVQGSTVFWYRDTVASSSGHETWASDELEWRQGQVPGMWVASLSRRHHRVSLVQWIAGTQAEPHTHPYGEEIFVLSGELRDEHGTYPAGSWTRLHPGSSHTPYAQHDTLILLRNGHLPS